MKTLIIIAVLIVALIWWLAPKKKSAGEITSQDGLEDAVKEDRIEGERYVNDHMRSVIMHPATEKMGLRKGDELHQLALKNKRKRPSR